MATVAFPSHESDPAQGRRRGVLFLLLGLLPALAAIWGVPWFVTQDGSAHLYNAQIIARSLDPDTPFGPFYTVRWAPVPNWGGHLLTALLVFLLPARAAGPAVTSITLVAFAASVAWLRYRVAGGTGMPLASVFAVVLALNMTWLFGFTSFVLGACLFPITLGVWWGGREHLGWGRVGALAVFFTLGYFCHLISLGLTAVGVGILALATPGPGRLIRLFRTAVAMIPLGPLGLGYLSQSRQGGPMHPLWFQLRNPFSIAEWGGQLFWVDPITIARKDVVPLVGLEPARWFGLFAPSVLFVGALIMMWVATILHRPAGAAQGHRDRAGWAWLAALLLISGVVGPDSLGPAHGEYLAQRVVLLGLVALVPILNFSPKGRLGFLAGAALASALAVQSAIVWDYALTCRRTAGAIMAAREAVGRNQRVATLLINIRSRFRANPLLHADNLLGVGTGNIIWNNYETRYYYFPVQFRPEVDRPSSVDLELVAITDDPKDVEKRACLWECLVENQIGAIDAVLVWGKDPALDAFNARWFDTVYQSDQVRVLRPRAAREPAP